MSVRVALIGNAFASRVQLPALRAVGGVDVVGIAGAQLAKAQRTAQEWEIGLATDRWQDLLALEPDLVLVSSPAHLHEPMVLELCAQSGAAILCEKPMAVSEEEAERMTNAAEGRLALIDHQLRFSPPRQALRRLLADGAIGELWHGSNEALFDTPDYASLPFSWWFDVTRGGGAFNALGSHFVDLSEREFGETLAIHARLQSFIHQRPDEHGELEDVTAEDYAVATLRSTTQAITEIRVSRGYAGGRGLRTSYLGSEGTITLDNEERLVLHRHGREPELIDAHLPTAAELGMPPLGPFARALPLYLRQVVAAVRDGRTELEDAATFAEGLRTQRILDAAHGSHFMGFSVGVFHEHIEEPYDPENPVL